MRIGNREFDTARGAYIMGILNVTPDSFSDGGRWNRLDAALAHGEAMVREGADILDVGGESTRPGYQAVPAEEEIRRVVPVIRALKERLDVPVSVDTWKAQVAEAALEAGADLVNDIWGLKGDPDMGRVIAAHGAACCLMHNREKAEYRELMPDILEDLRGSLKLAAQAGIPQDRILLDPGIGFAKNREQNLEVLRNLGQLRALGFPVLLGTSRKSVIGQTLDLPADQRVEGTLATSVLGLVQGCAFFRVHDVKENWRAIRMAEAIGYYGGDYGSDTH